MGACCPLSHQSLLPKTSLQAPASQAVSYVAFDLRARAKAGAPLLSELQALQAPLLAATGVFVGAGGGAASQRGVLRTNCIDCLDRSNVAAATYALLALGRQVHALGLAESPRLDPGSDLAAQLLLLYEAHGNALARQYGGSEAHAGFFLAARGSDWGGAATQHSRDVLTSIRRFYSNVATDADKQDAINLFLGNFVPAPGAPALWELESDVYLHNSAGEEEEASRVLCVCCPVLCCCQVGKALD